MKVAIQGELGSNSHMAALAMLGRRDPALSLVPTMLSAETCSAVQTGEADVAVLPIENTLHGSVLEHYDLLFERPLRLTEEYNLRIQHNVIAAPGVALASIRRVLSHPVALSQCRRWLRAHPEIEAVPFYDTAGSVKHILQQERGETAAIAPVLASQVYGGVVLEGGVEDHPENFTRFHLIVREAAGAASTVVHPDKMTVAFTLDHRPGALVAVLEAASRLGANLTKIESRPVHGRPWEYVFYVDVRLPDGLDGDAVLAAVRPGCRELKELGRYKAAGVAAACD